MNLQVDAFLEKEKKWKSEMTLLREIVLECTLEEDYKWMHPCYTYQGKNVVLIHQFKEYCALLFFKGVLLNDPHQILIQQTENVQDRRQIRFTHLDEIKNSKEVILEYIQAAIELEKSGAQVEFKCTEDFKMPLEFKQKIEQNSELKLAFDRLTPGRQRAYLLYFSAPKQSKTKEMRIEKSIPQILLGKGFND